MEILDGQADCSYFEFHRTLNTLSLRVAGASALSYVEMMKRRERLAFYAQVRAEARKGLALLTVLRSLSFPSSQSDWTHAGVGGVQGCSLLRTASTRSGRAGPGLKPRHLDSDTRSLVGGCAVHVDLLMLTMPCRQTFLWRTHIVTVPIHWFWRGGTAGGRPSASLCVATTRPCWSLMPQAAIWKSAAAMWCLPTALRYKRISLKMQMMAEANGSNAARPLTTNMPFTRSKLRSLGHSFE